VKSILRFGLSVVLATVLAVTAAWAVEYDDIFELTERGVSERTIVQLIVDDGRAFELDQDELADLRAAGVSEVVIDAMLDPAVGRAWLSGGTTGTTGGGYSTSLDEAYNQGYSAGVSSTALVFSFGYYYGPLARYYYCDPFYYPFWYSGYGYSYWPSYYSYWYRPYYDCYYAYPYNWYGYSSYYCHSYYDAGYWGHNGYSMPPGYNHSVWDNGPRFRGGGVTPPKGGRPYDGTENGRVVTGGTNRMRNPSAPPAIREAEGGRTPSDRGGAGSGLATRTGRGIDTPSARTPSSRGSGTRVIRGTDGSSGTSGGSSTARVIRGSGATRGAERSAGGERVSSTQPRRLRDSADRVMRSGRTGSSRRSAWSDATGSSRSIVRPYGRPVADGRAGMVERGVTSRVERSAGYARPGGGRAPAAAPQARSGGGGGSAPSGGASHGGSRGGGAPSGGGGHGGGGSRGGGANGGGGGSRGGR
jgi:hypothetical protein